MGDPYSLGQRDYHFKGHTTTRAGEGASTSIQQVPRDVSKSLAKFVASNRATLPDPDSYPTVGQDAAQRSSSSQTPASSHLRSRSASLSTGNTSFTPSSPEWAEVQPSRLQPEILYERLFRYTQSSTVSDVLHHSDGGNSDKFILPTTKDGSLSLPFAPRPDIIHDATGINTVQPSWNEYCLSGSFQTYPPLPFMHSSLSQDQTVPESNIEASANRLTCLSYGHRQNPMRPKARPLRARPLSSHLDHGIKVSTHAGFALPPNSCSMAQSRRCRVSTPQPLPLRKTPEKKMCTICRAAQSGKKYEFRGQHELDRHNNKQHSDENKRWVCHDPTPDKRHSWCKNCREKKQYAVNYNAAEHIRRAHLHPDGSERLGKKTRDIVAGEQRVNKSKRTHNMPSIQELIQAGWIRVKLPEDDLHTTADSRFGNKEYTEGPGTDLEPVNPVATDATLSPEVAYMSYDSDMSNLDHHLNTETEIAQCTHPLYVRSLAMQYDGSGRMLTVHNHMYPLYNADVSSVDYTYTQISPSHGFSHDQILGSEAAVYLPVSQPLYSYFPDLRMESA